MQLYFPFQLDGRGRVAEADESTHVRQLIEQLLFTSPGERVNRPDFGCGLLTALFGPGRQEELIALQYLVQQQLQRWLGQLIEPREVELRQEENLLYVTVRYVERRTGAAHAATYEVAPL